jgi:hypothetical protein
MSVCVSHSVWDCWLLSFPNLFPLSPTQAPRHDPLPFSHSHTRQMCNRVPALHTDILVSANRYSLGLFWQVLATTYPLSAVQIFDSFSFSLSPYFLFRSSFSCRVLFPCFTLIGQESAYHSNKYYLARVGLSKRNGALANRWKWIRMDLTFLILYKERAEL